MKIKFWLVTITIVILSAGVIALFQPHIQDRIVQRGVERQIEANQNIPDYGNNALDVVFCGTASPMGNGERAQQCIAIFAGPHFFIFDAGARSTANVAQLGLPVERLSGIFLTHFHSDHISSLGELHLLSWVRGREGKLNLYGGPGVSQVADGFNLAYGQDYVYRTAHHGADYLSPKNAGFVAKTIVAPPSGVTTVFDKDGVRVEVFEVIHPPIRPAYGYRICYQARCVVVSGDTSASMNLQMISRDADVLIHEVLHEDLTGYIAQGQTKAGMARIGKIIADTPDYHTTPINAAKIAQAANVGLLVFTHFAPPPQNKLVEQIYMRNLSSVLDVDKVILADDGLFLRLPVGEAGVVKRVSLK